MNLSQKPLLIYLLCLGLMGSPRAYADSVSPAAVGWGNLIVPGLGATIRKQPTQGLVEAITEIGLFYGGTFGAREGSFNIDSTIVLPQNGHLARPLVGTILQQAGLKLHMYDTFYHYQQAALAVADTERERKNPQPLYGGSAWDVLLAPFQWKYMRSPWVWGLTLISATVIYLNYHSTPIKRATYTATTAEDLLYGASQVGAIPLGSAFGEEPLFRGFIQREFRLYTGSLLLSVLGQAILFTSIHPSDAYATAFTGGIYFGFLTEISRGDLGPAIAAHFWVNFFDGIFNYLAFRRGQGKNTPGAPPLTLHIAFPF